MNEKTVYVESKSIDSTNTTKRKRTKPSYLGASEEKFDSSIDEEKDNSFLRELADNSLDDETYVPEKSQKVIATVKRKRTDHSRNVDQGDFDSSNFDQLFDKIDSNLQENVACTSDLSSQKTSMLIGSDAKASDAVNVPSEDLNGRNISEEKKCNSPIKSLGISDCTSVNMHCNQDILKLFDRLDRKLDNILSRITVLESTVLRSMAGISHYAKPNDIKIQEEPNIFMKSNCLPTKNIDDLEKFQENLEDSAFYNVSVKILSDMTRMGLGKSVDDDSAVKTLKTALNLVIHRVFLSEFTWTGKSKPNSSRKRAFRKQEKLQQILLQIVSKFHPNYNQTKLENHLVNKILKSAYEIPKKFLSDESKNACDKFSDDITTKGQIADSQVIVSTKTRDGNDSGQRISEMASTPHHGEMNHCGNKAISGGAVHTGNKFYSTSELAAIGNVGYHTNTPMLFCSEDANGNMHYHQREPMLHYGYIDQRNRLMPQLKMSSSVTGRYLNNLTYAQSSEQMTHPN